MDKPSLLVTGFNKESQASAVRGQREVVVGLNPSNAQFDAEGQPTVFPNLAGRIDRLQEVNRAITAELRAAGIGVMQAAEVLTDDNLFPAASFAPPPGQVAPGIIVYNDEAMEQQRKLEEEAKKQPLLYVRGEVPATLVGTLTTKWGDEVIFRRAWYYWTVRCKVPLGAAEAMYADEVGAKKVRVSGHCGCPPPAGWATPMTPEGRNVILRSEVEKYKAEGPIRECLDKLIANGERVVVDGLDGLAQFVTSYHIDNQDGLDLFARTVRP